MGPCDWQLTMSVVFVYKNGNILLLLLYVLDPPVGLYLLLQLGLSLREALLDLGHQQGEQLVGGGR